MKTTSKSLSVVLLIVSICVSIAAAGAPMGPPIAVLEEGQWSLGGELAYGQTDMEASGRVTDVLLDYSWSQRFEIKDLSSTILFGDVAYGICDNWDIFVRVGVADASDDIVLPPADTGISQRRDSFDGDFGLAWGVGTRATFCRLGPWSFGGSAQVTWFKPGESDFAIEDPYLPDETWAGQAELDYWQTEISLAAVYQVDAWRFWGGPFLQFVGGNLDFSGQAHLAGLSDELSWTGDLKESSQVGGFVGASWDVSEQWDLWVEGQVTGDSWLISIGAAFVPDAFIR